MKQRNLIQSLNDAVEGILHTVRTQVNMRIHIFIALLVLIVAAVLDVARDEYVILVLTIGMVLTAEGINTAIEATVDLVTDRYHPLAKIAKNAAAGAVLIAAITSVFVGYLVFFRRLVALADVAALRFQPPTEAVILISMGAVLLVTVLAKAGATPFRIQGGFPSAHSAIAFSLATVIAILASGGIVTVLAVGLAALVGQARLEAGIHTFIEVAAGAALGILLTLLLFQLLL